MKSEGWFRLPGGKWHYDNGGKTLCGRKVATEFDRTDEKPPPLEVCWRCSAAHKAAMSEMGQAGE